jgi:hypothetical protein
MSPDRLVLVATIVYAAVMLATATIRAYPVVLALLVFGGAAWLALLATFQSGAQLAVPSWVRGRAIAAYLMVFFGGQAGGAVVWGSVAERVGIPLTLLMAAGGLVLGLGAGVRFRLGAIERLDLAPSRHWPAAHALLPADADRDRLPVLVVTEYRIRPADAPRFAAAMAELRRARLRSGAVRWELYRDANAPESYVEHFVVPSWNEHLRQHERVTGVDRRAQETVRALHAGVGPPDVTHFIASAESAM